MSHYHEVKLLMCPDSNLLENGTFNMNVKNKFASIFGNVRDTDCINDDPNAIDDISLFSNLDEELSSLYD